MEITLTTDNKEEYLLIRSTGSVASKDDIIAHSRMIFDEIAKTEHKKILVDVVAITRPSSLLIYYEVVQHYLKDFPRDIRLLKIALVITPKDADLGKFWETTAVNRGLQYHAFITLQEAHEWLLS